jgi:hypothetical protein
MEFVMKISTLSDLASQTAASPKNSLNGLNDGEAIVSSDTSAVPAASATNVTISEKARTLAADAVAGFSKVDSDGMTTMLKRLYGVSTQQAAPIETKVTSDNIGKNMMAFLNQDDRKFLASAYQYASDNDVDPEQVDHLAFDMGHYRFMSMTGGNFEQQDGQFWNTDGSPLYMQMTPSDTELAKQMLTSEDINNTTLDQGFLAYELNPRAIGWTNDTNRGHAADYGFLQKLISATSSTGGDPGKQSASISAPFANALARINNQDKPLLPPAGWNVPQTATDATSDATNVKQALDKFSKITNPSEDQFNTITALFSVQTKHSEVDNNKRGSLSFFAQHLLDLARAQQDGSSQNALNAVINGKSSFK